MTMPLPPVGSFIITGQSQTKAQVLGSTMYQDGVNITFLTGYGVTGSVFVPNNQYTAENVKAAVIAKVAVADSVSELTNH